MKTICIIAVASLSFVLAIELQADLVVTRHDSGFVNPLNGTADTAYQNQIRIYNTYHNTHSDSGWRVINGFTNQVTDKWVQFSGTVLEVHDGGVRIQGWFVTLDGAQNFNGEFFVAGFAGNVAQDDPLDGRTVWHALPGGVYKYNTVSGGTRTLHQLIYGTPCAAPQKSPEQIWAEELAAQKNLARKKTEGAAAALKANLSQCAAGDAYGQLRMAERYRDGDGVATNLSRARALFEMSADQDNPTAVRELAQLTNAAPARSKK
jgi:hypothetical protein